MATDYTIEQLRAEFASHGVQGFLWQWLHEQLVHAARATIMPRYAAAFYSPAGEWTAEAIGDLANDFIANQGIDRGVIATGLARSSDTATLRAYLGRSFKNFVVDSPPRSTQRNIFERLRDVLDKSMSFMRLAGTPPRSYFGLAEWSDDHREPATELDLESAHRFIPGGVTWVAYESGERQSPGISSSDLERIALAVMQGTNRLVSAKQLMSVIKRRFVLDASEVEWDESKDQSAPDSSTVSPLELIAAREAAERILEQLTSRQLDILFEQLNQGAAANVRSVAEALGLRKSTVGNEMRRIAACFRDADIAGEDQLYQVLEVIRVSSMSG